MRVLAIGECMAELAPAETAGRFALGFAGDTFNTAWYLTKIMPTAEVSYFTAIGTDTLSQDLKDFMDASGLQSKHVQIIPDRTLGLYMITLTDGERSFTYWRGQSAARALAADPEALIKAMDAADLIYFSGITLAILDQASKDTLSAAARAARAAGKTIAFDPNLRPRLWTSTDRMTETIMEAAAVSDIVLPSYEDEADWFGDATPGGTLQRYLDVGASCVVVKNGPAPVLYSCDGAQGEIAITPVESVVDTTAAGDSFNAGLLAGRAATQDIAKGIASGAALARWVVSNKGALVPMDAFTLPV